MTSAAEEERPRPSNAAWPSDGAGGAEPEAGPARFRIDWCDRRGGPAVPMTGAGEPFRAVREMPPDEIEMQQRGSWAANEPELRAVRVHGEARVRERFRNFQPNPAALPGEWEVVDGVVVAAPDLSEAAAEESWHVSSGERADAEESATSAGAEPCRVPVRATDAPT